MAALYTRSLAQSGGFVMIYQSLLNIYKVLSKLVYIKRVLDFEIPKHSLFLRFSAQS